MDMKTGLDREAIRVGEPLPWDLVNAEGRILFRKGFIVHSETNRQRLLAMGLRPREDDGLEPATPDPAPPPMGSGPFRQLEYWADRTQDCFDHLSRNPRSRPGEIREIVSALQALYREHEDACLAAIHFNHHRPYSCLHPVYSLFLAELFATATGYPGDTGTALAGAALTANLGMYEYHDEWATQAGPLDEAQQRVRLAHPDESVRRLRAAGITDPLWLRTVRQHHEHPDGSGYPQGLKGGEILREALVLAVIDRYLAFVMPRQGRRPLYPTAALKKLYEDAAKYDMDIVANFIKLLGIYPPGTLVRLVNGELAVVIRRRANDALHPEVVSLGYLDGDWWEEPRPRDTREPPYRIKGAHPMEETQGLTPARVARAWL